MPSRQAKHWVFTINNYTNEHKDSLQTLRNPTNPTEVVYVVYGEEVGESGTPHLQGFISFTKRLAFGRVRSILPDGAWFEPAKGTPAEAAQYCKKDGAFTEVGILPTGRGARSDIAAVQQAIKGGAKAGEIRDEFFGIYCRYERAILRYCADLAPKRDWQPTVTVLWGEAGAGKTRSVYDYHNADEIYMHTGQHWFDGYNGQEIVLFDDFHGGIFRHDYFMKLIDRYPMQVPIKGGFVQWTPKVIYLTSNKDPNDWYPGVNEEQQRAMKRRFSTVTHMTRQ